MAMSRQHFEAIASAISSVSPNTVEHSVIKRRIVLAIASELAVFNSRFDKDKFARASLSHTDAANLQALDALNT